MFVKLEWRLLGFAGMSFLLCLLLLGTLSGKHDFWVGKIIFVKLESGDCGDLLGFGLADCPAKSDFGVGKVIFVKLESGGCWALLGCLSCCAYCCLAHCPENKNFWVGKIIFVKLESGDCGDLLGFGLADCPAKSDFGVGKVIFVKLESGGCWDLLGFLLLRCLLLLGTLSGKQKIFLGSGKSFL